MPDRGLLFILIAGGSDKELNFENFAEEILVRSKGLVLFKGAGTEKLLQALRRALPEGERERKFEIVETTSQVDGTQGKPRRDG